MTTMRELWAVSEQVKGYSWIASLVRCVLKKVTGSIGKLEGDRLLVLLLAWPSLDISMIRVDHAMWTL